MARPTENLPGEMAMQMGKIIIRKGVDDDASVLVQWDAMPLCIDTECAIFTRCHYKKDREKPCTLMKQYVKSVALILHRNFVFDESQLFRVGMELMPMYVILCQLKMYQLTIQNPVSTTDKGLHHMNPIYREIREMIKSISRTWESIGARPKNGRGSNIPANIDDFLEGDLTYHEMLEKGPPPVPKNRLVTEEK